MFERLHWILKTFCILQKPNALLRSFWSFVKVWNNNSPKKGRTSVKAFFSVVNIWGLLK